MHPGKLALIGFVLVGAVAATLSLVPSGTSKTVRAAEQNASASPSNAEPASAAASTATKWNVLKNTVRLAEANMNVWRMAKPESAAAETGRIQADEYEKKLGDAMAQLTAQLARDPSAVNDAIAMLENESDPAMMAMLAQAIGQSADSLGDKFPHDKLLKIALNDPSPDRRRAALNALSYMSKVSPELQQQIAELSRTAQSNEVRIAAVECMGAWMAKNRALIHPVSETLLATRTASDDDDVRGIVIQTIGNQDAPLSKKVFDAMVDAVAHEPAPHSRSLAAVALGSGVGPENREAIIGALEAAYLSEKNVTTQRHLITQITKAARYDAEDYLQRLPTPHPLLAQDVEDYVEILASADRKNWGSIWDQKSERDHQRGTYPSGDGGHGEQDQ